MRRTIILLLWIASVPMVALGQTPASCVSHTSDVLLQPFASETITVSSTAIGFTATTYAPSGATGSYATRAAYVTTETDNVRIWVDGSTPSSTVGHLVTPGSVMVVCQGSLARFRAIRTSGDAKLVVTYFRNPQ